MNNEPANWRALADALQYAMTETGVEPTQDYVQATALDALAWLDKLGYTLVMMSHCWCEGMAEGNEHTPGCAGIEQDELLNSR